MSPASSAPSPDSAPSRPPRRHVVKVLAPQTAPRLPGQSPPKSTLYLADRLVVVGDPTTIRDALAALMYDLGDARTVQMRRPSESRRMSLLAGTEAAQDAREGTLPITSFSVGHASAEVDRTADAWQVLQELRARHPDLAMRVRLEHVIRPPEGYWDGLGGTWSDGENVWHGVGEVGTDSGYWGGTSGYWGGTSGYWGGTSGYWGGTGVAKAEYETPGRGGRLPVSVVLKDPSLRARHLTRHPVVAIPDSGLGQHPWFPEGATWANETLKVLRAPDLSSLPDSDATSQGDEFSGARGRLFGHGTFIAGIVRQGCPEATIFPIPVMTQVGTAAEADVLTSLGKLLALHRAALAGDAERRYIIDVLTLSIGYYASHEEDDDDSLDDDDAEDLRSLLSSPLAALLRQFGDSGVLVVAGVGNDATPRRFLPAALAPEWTGEHDPTQSVPMVSVGALNPDGTTIAMFSNSGSFTTTYRKGVSVVSTLPTTNASTQSTFRFTTRAGDRSTVDVDDYTQGFGVWSGTSFAAPTLAAELAAAIVEVGGDQLDDTSLSSMKERGWKALAQVLAINPASDAGSRRIPDEGDQ